MGKKKISNEAAYSLMFCDCPDVLDVQRMSLMLGISIKTGYRLLKENKIASLRIGRAYRIPKPCVIDYLLEKNVRE